MPGLRIPTGQLCPADQVPIFPNDWAGDEAGCEYLDAPERFQTVWRTLRLLLQP